MYSTDHRLPAALGYAMPPEWAAHEGCLMAFPCRRGLYGSGGLAAARRAYARLAHAIGEFEPVTMVVAPRHEKTARRMLSASVEILPLPLDDAWMRDSGPTYLVHRESGEVAGVDWLFNAWGGKYRPCDRDDAVAAALLRRQRRRRFLAPLVMEGGSFHVNGGGVAMTTEQCLLHKNRNPRLEKGDIENLLRGYLGARAVLWLAGDRRDDETDGHVDNIACFGSERLVLLMADDSDSMLAENRRRLRQARLPDGGSYDIIPLPRPQLAESGDDLLASYVNFYFANGAIVMPSFGVAEDARARSVLAEAFPSRRIAVVDAVDIVRGGGGIHCVTQQIPAPRAAR